MFFFSIKKKKGKLRGASRFLPCILVDIFMLLERNFFFRLFVVGCVCSLSLVKVGFDLEPDQLGLKATSQLVALPYHVQINGQCWALDVPARQ